jgi:hypothetical protein
MLLAVMTLASACTPTGGNSCAGWKPIRLAEASIDGLTDQDAGEVLAHNEFGRARGCW